MARNTRKNRIANTLAVCFWLCAWQAASVCIGQKLILVSPLEVCGALLALLPTADFWQTAAFSAGRIIGGFLLALALGLVLAALAAALRWVEVLLRPLMLTIKSIPVASFIILALMWLRSAGNLAVFISFLMVLPVVYTNTLAGIRETDVRLLEMAAVFRVPPAKRVRYLYVPAALPYFRSACTVGLGLCWKSGGAAGVIGITGPLACGKSTLGRLLLGELPYTGSLRINGLEIAQLNSAQISHLVGYLGHAPQLLSDTIEENIQLGEDLDCAPWLKLTALKEEVVAMPEGLKTQIGAQGTRLSGGQQARLALARTLARPRPVWVLDDPFSAVDPATEDEILRNLRVLGKDRIILLISHRLTHFAQFDQVLWLENGTARIADPATMMAENPAYARLVKTQQKKAGDDDEK